jgi:hypothetical protein
MEPGDETRQSEHKDIAHPITAECREYIQKKVIDAYENERKKGPSKPAPAAPPQTSGGRYEAEEDDIEL